MKEYRDRYLGFTYNKKTLNMTAEADFYGFIENSGNELSFFNTPGFTNEFVVPQYGEKTIYTGNTKSNRVFNLKVQLDKISLHDYRKFLEWLNPDNQGTLIFDYNPNYGYKVKVQSVSNSEFHVLKKRNHNEDFYYADMSIDFITVDDYAAKWVGNEVYYPIPDPNSAGVSLVDNELYEDFIEEKEEEEDEYTIYNYHNVKNYFTIEFNDSLTIKKGGDKLVEISSAGNNAIFYSEYGIALTDVGNFLPCGSKASIALEANSNETFEITTGTNGAINKIYPSSREIL